MASHFAMHAPAITLWLADGNPSVPCESMFLPLRGRHSDPFRPGIALESCRSSLSQQNHTSKSQATAECVRSYCQPGGGKGIGAQAAVMLFHSQRGPTQLAFVV